MSAIFPKWTNILPTVVAIAVVGGLSSVVAGFWYWATPEFWEVGYMPKQPGGGFNHQIHAGKLGKDCRYCHTNVEKSPEANIPVVASCYGCHAENRLAVLNNSQTHRSKTNFIREAYATDAPIEWERVHKLPDYVRNFPHHAHVNAGVSCYSCHGRIDTMPVVYQAESLSMAWCLECHRAPEESLVPKDKVTQLQWVQDHLAERTKGSSTELMQGQMLLDALTNAPPQNCGACHY